MSNTKLRRKSNQSNYQTTPSIYNKTFNFNNQLNNQQHQQQQQHNSNRKSQSSSFNQKSQHQSRSQYYGHHQNNNNHHHSRQQQHSTMQERNAMEKIKNEGGKLLNEIRPIQINPNLNAEEEHVGLELTGALDKRNAKE